MPRVDGAAGALDSLPAEVRFLITAGRSIQAAAGVPMRPLEWHALPLTAHRHGLSALLRPAFAHCREVPLAVAQQSRQLDEVRTLFALQAMAEIVRLVDALRRTGIRAIALKGPAFSHWLYGDLGFRRFSDIDLLVAPDERDRACEAIQQSGYALPAGMSRKAAAAVYGGLGAWPLRKQGSLPVDLHWQLAHRRFPVPLTARDVIAESRPLPDVAPGVDVPSPAHQAVLTLLHAAKHLWCTLEMSLAIARLMQRADVDWPRVEALLRAGHGWRGGATGLALASELFEVDVPRTLAMAVAADARPDLRQAALKAVQSPEGVFADRWHERRAHRAALDTVGDRLAYDAWRFVSPTPLDWEWWPLPDRLTALYAPLRVVRLGTMAARRMLRQARSAVIGTALAQARRDDGATPSIHDGPESPRTSA